MSRSKPVIILIHGLRGTHHGLTSIARQLSAKYKVITPDLPGSGTRMELSDGSLDAYVDWLHGYIQGLHLRQKPYIVGHSMGSMIVSHFLQKYPDDVAEKVVLMSPIFRDKFHQKSSNCTYHIVSGLLHILPEKPRYAVLSGKPMSYCISHYLVVDKSQQKTIDEQHYRYSGRFSSSKVLMDAIKISMLRQTIIPPHKKVLIIMGEKDKLTSQQLALQHAKKHNVDCVILENSGHLINYEKAHETAQQIAKFIG